MASRHAFVKPLPLLLFSLALAVSLFYNFRHLSEIRSLEAEIDDHVLREKLLEEKNERCREAVPPGPDWKERITESISDPRDHVLDDLLSRRDLVPWEGVLGGTMKIHRGQDVWFFGPSWCLAYAEDGHIGGYMLLSYEIEETKVEWKLLEAAPLE
ncbi:MAG: hypothetical protein ACP5DY_01270 [Thermovirgaceae bacterium]